MPLRYPFKPGTGWAATTKGMQEYLMIFCIEGAVQQLNFIIRGMAAMRPFFDNGGNWEELNAAQQAAIVLFRNACFEEWEKECFGKTDADLMKARCLLGQAITALIPQLPKVGRLACDKCGSIFARPAFNMARHQLTPLCAKVAAGLAPMRAAYAAYGSMTPAAVAHLLCGHCKYRFGGSVTDGGDVLPARRPCPGHGAHEGELVCINCCMYAADHEGLLKGLEAKKHKPGECETACPACAAEL